jgi:hypothetical protein
MNAGLLDPVATARGSDTSGKWKMKNLIWKMENPVFWSVAIAHRQTTKFSIYHFPFEIFHLNECGTS